MLVTFKTHVFHLFLFVSLVFATKLLGVREVPERLVHSKTNPNVVSPPLSAGVTRSPLHLMGVVPNTKVRLKTDYIKEFLAFLSLNNFRILSDGNNAPLKTKFTNLERILSDDSDLRTWTRFIVENDRDEDFSPVKETSPTAESIDLKIDDFIEYLVEHRGFNGDDLQFLHDTNFNMDYDSIDEELTDIKASQLPTAVIDSLLTSASSRMGLNGIWILLIGIYLL